MSIEQAPYYLKKLKIKFLALRLTEILLLALSAALLVYGVTGFFDSGTTAFVASSATGIITFSVCFVLFGLHRVNEYRLVRFINQRYPQLEESGDLLLKEQNALSVLEQLQQQKVIEKFTGLYPDISLPHHIKRSIVLLGISFIITAGLSAFQAPSQQLLETKTITKHQPGKKPAVLPASIQKLSIQITPPAYTGLASYTSDNPELDIPEASRVMWSLTFSRQPEQAFLLFPGHDSAQLVMKHGKLTAGRPINESGFYQITWKSDGETKTSDYYKIQVTRDQAPDISIPDLAPFTELTLHDKLTIGLHSLISDDYTVRDAYIIATVAKGSGESVKFREEKLRFTSPAKMQGRQIKADRALDILKLGLEPGDELYFYAEALDNKEPFANRSRTETYFITLQDTAEQNTDVEAGLGVDLMPEYFRSQRQIIIDTEKLLKEKKKISQHQFKSTSNELGYDQKVLRLKYGEFLGEEFETQIGPAESSADEADATPEDIAKQYGHVHDTENEHNLVQEKKTESKPDHDHQEGEEKENILDAYTHVHDDPEEATFFLQSVRTKLKAALTQMWDAELYLRIFEPEKSLPYQYKALRLLKEVSNDSRIYVHKTGFDPPPLKEEKRLSGDLSEIRPTNQQINQTESETLPAIRRAIEAIESRLTIEPVSVTDKDKNILLAAGNELSALALKQPGKFLPALSLIKAINENEVRQDNLAPVLRALKRICWIALPSKTASPDVSCQTLHPLDQTFLKNLGDLKNE